MSKKKIFSIILFTLGIFLLGIYHIYYGIKSEEDKIIISEYIKEENILDEEKKILPLKISKILGVLEIPKINLKKEFYAIDSNENNVNKNITVLKGSSMPNILGKTLFLAAHSGNSYLGYFKNLLKLTKEDNLIIHYQQKKYFYYINDIYELPKNGTIEINKNTHENYLVLTTCHNNNQLVMTAKLLKIE